MAAACRLANVKRSTFENLRRKALHYRETNFRDMRFKARLEVEQAIAALMNTKGGVEAKISCEMIARHAQQKVTKSADRPKVVARKTVRRILKSRGDKFRRDWSGPSGRWYAEREQSIPVPNKESPQNERPQLNLTPKRVADSNQDETDAFADIMERWARKGPRGKDVERPIAEFVQANRADFLRLVMESANKLQREGPTFVEEQSTEKAVEWKYPVSRFSHNWTESKKELIGRALRLSEENAKGEVWCFVEPKQRPKASNPYLPRSYLRFDLRGRVRSAFSDCANGFVEMVPKPSFAATSWDKINEQFTDWLATHNDRISAAVPDPEQKNRLVARLRHLFAGKLLDHLRVQLRAILTEDCRIEVEKIEEDPAELTAKKIDPSWAPTTFDPSWALTADDLSLSEFRRIVGETWIRKQINFHCQSRGSIWGKPAFKKLSIYAPYWEVIEQWEGRGLPFREVCWQCEKVRNARASRREIPVTRHPTNLNGSTSI